MSIRPKIMTSPSGTWTVAGTFVTALQPDNQHKLAVRGWVIVAAAVLSLVGCGRKDQAAKSTKKQGGKTPVVDKVAPKKGSETTPKAADVQTPPTPEVSQFSDVAAASGIDFRFYADAVPGRFFLVESMGGAVAWLDYDLDGFQDAYFTNGFEIAAIVAGEDATNLYGNRLYRNTGAGFDASGGLSGTRDPGYGFGVAIGDFDVDGFPDIFVANFGRNTLLRNNGDGTYSASQPDEAAMWSTGCVWFDANDDQLPDLYVANYLTADYHNNKVCDYDGQPGYCGPQNFEPQADQVFVNNGDGTFRDATEELGFKVPAAYSLGVMATDLSGDHRPEIIVATDMTANSLFSRKADGTWSDRAHDAGVATAGNGAMEAGMGIACADFDNDGAFDFLLTHYYEKKNTLYRNLGDMLFTDESFRSRIAITSTQFLGFGTNVVDVNHDSAPDLFIANGHVLGPNHEPSTMSAQILLNDGRGRFSDVSAASGDYFQKLVLGRGSATADYDNDGDTDIAVVHLDDPVGLLQQQGAPEDWIGLHVLDSARCGLAGGQVTLRQGTMTRSIPLVDGGSYLSVSDARILSAIPGKDDVAVEITFPGGDSATHTLTPGRYWTITRAGANPTVR